MEIIWKKVQKLQMRREDRLPTDFPASRRYQCVHTPNDIM